MTQLFGCAHSRSDRGPYGSRTPGANVESGASSMPSTDTVFVAEYPAATQSSLAEIDPPSGPAAVLHRGRRVHGPSVVESLGLRKVHKTRFVHGMCITSD